MRLIFLAILNHIGILEYSADIKIFVIINQFCHARLESILIFRHFRHHHAVIARRRLECVGGSFCPGTLVQIAVERDLA